MTAKEVIQHAWGGAHLSMSQLAEKLGMSRALFNNRCKTGKFTLEEWRTINEAIGDNILLKYINMSFTEKES